MRPVHEFEGDGLAGAAMCQVDATSAEYAAHIGIIRAARVEHIGIADGMSSARV